jgi:cystathionine beta-lyase
MSPSKSSGFDPPIERRGSDSTKWGRFASSDHDVIGAWVADMDLPSSDRIIEAVKARLDERVFGYAMQPPELIPVIQDRLQKKYGWKTEEDWYVILPGIVPALFFASSCLGNVGDAVMAARPNYHYFLETAAQTGRNLQTVNCQLADGRWEMDFDEMRESINERTRMFLLCNPHNPVGRALTREELETVAGICLENGTMICSDEIHADLILDPDRHHIPIASLDEEIEKHTITLISASKAFNLPGLSNLALAVIPDPDLRTAFENQSFGYTTSPTALSYAATLTAFRDCEDWLQDTLEYLRGNRDFLEAQITDITGLHMSHVEATFLAWINVTETGLNNPADTFHEHGVAVSDGSPMGDENHVRLNFACHRSTLEEIVTRLRTAVASAA